MDARGNEADAWVKAAIGRRGLGLAFLGIYPWLAFLVSLWLHLALGLLALVLWLALVRADAEDAREAEQADEMRDVYEVAQWRAKLALRRQLREKGGPADGKGA